MILANLMKQIIGKELSPFYIFECEDRSLADIYLGKMVEMDGLERVGADSILPVLKSLSAGSLVSRKRRLFVIRDDKTIITTEQIWSKIHELKGNDVIVLIYSPLDKRTKFYKEFLANIVEFPTLESAILKKHLSRYADLTPMQLTDIIQLTGNNLGYAISEADKVKNYAEAVGITDAESYDILRANHMIGEEPSDTLFKGVNAALSGNVKACYEYLANEEPVTTLAGFYNVTKQMFLCQTEGDKEVLKNVYGMSDMVININRTARTIYSPSQLLQIMMLSIDVEQKMKLGIVPMESAIDWFLGKLFSGNWYN